MTSLAARERAALCDLFDRVGPDAPTLCEGWTTADLAAHLWVRENEPWAAVGVAVPALAGLTESRMRTVLHRLGFRGVVDELRRGAHGITPFRFGAVDRLVNSAELFIHHEDVRRAGDQPQPPRRLDPGDQDRLWSTARMMGRMLMRRSPVGVVAERPGGGSVRLHPGTSTVTLIGEPSELLLALSGRRDAADVTVLGDDDAVARFLAYHATL